MTNDWQAISLVSACACRVPSPSPHAVIAYHTAPLLSSRLKIQVKYLHKFKPIFVTRDEFLAISSARIAPRRRENQTTEIA